MLPRKILKIGPRKCDFQRSEMQVEDVYFFKINLNFALTSKKKKEETKEEFAKRSWGQQSSGIMVKSRSQLNKATGLRGVPC